MPYTAVIQDKVKHNIPQSKLKSGIANILKNKIKYCTIYWSNSRAAFSAVGQMLRFSLRPFFFFFLANEIILGHLVRLAFIYIENIQTFTSVPFGWENSAHDELRHMINERSSARTAQLGCQPVRQPDKCVATGVSMALSFYSLLRKRMCLL